MSWCVGVLQMSDDWARMLKWLIQQNCKDEFWVKRYFIAKTVPIALKEPNEKDYFGVIVAS
jgi:hypothetical protein